MEVHVVYEGSRRSRGFQGIVIRGGSLKTHQLVRWHLAHNRTELSELVIIACCL